MAKIIVVTSGKGGVGKTTTSASFATGLALRGHKTAVIDFDVGLRNARPVAKLALVVVLPTPPLPEVTTMIFAMGGESFFIGSEN